MTVPNIIYLLGAGASAQNKVNTNNSAFFPRMPLANNFHEVIEEKYLINNRIGMLFPEILFDNGTIFKLREELTDFAKFIRKHETIDEAMRKLLLNQHFDIFNKYKSLISIVFYLIESIDNYHDSRYSQFLLTLVNNDFRLDENIYILNWNYDNQFKIAANEMIAGNYNDITLSSKNYHEINGSANLIRLKDSKNTGNNKHLDEIKLKNNGINEILFNTPNIKFAWEDIPDKNGKTMKENLNDFLSAIKGEENYLVVIGYSFPFVNHLYDLDIIKKLKPEKIYFQNFDNLTEPLEERFRSIFIGPMINDTKRFYYIKDCNRFYIPNEIYKIN